MKDLRKTLQKHIYETFRVNRIPFFVGMKGIGKHYAIEAYAQQYNFKTVHLSNELPEHEDTIYICDDLNDIDYIQKLSSFLLKNNYKVCFISDNLPLIEMYELVTNKLELFYAVEFMFSYSDTKIYCKKFLKNDLEILNIYQNSLGNIYVINHLLRYSFDKYLEAYIHTSQESLTSLEKQSLETLMNFSTLEKEAIGLILNNSIDSLINKGFIFEKNNQIQIPPYLNFNHPKDKTFYSLLHQYYLDKGYYAKSFRYASDTERKELLKTKGMEVVLSLKEEELDQYQEIEYYFLPHVFKCFRQQKQQEIRNLLKNKIIKDEDYMLALLLLDTTNLSEWIQQIKEKKMKIHLPIQLFYNGILKSRLSLVAVLNHQELYNQGIEILDEESLEMLQLLKIEDAIENNNLTLANQLIFKQPKPQTIELKFILSEMLTRLHLIQGYYQELTEIPFDIKEEILKRDDSLTQSYEMFELEKAVILNQQDVLAQYYLNERESTNPYYQLLMASLLYRLNFYEKSIAKMNTFIYDFQYHGYIMSHLKYVYALNYYALNQEKQALKLLIESLMFNGPLRYSSYYSYFGKETIQLMQIYIHFLKNEVKGKKKYRNALDTSDRNVEEYQHYIEQIIDNASRFTHNAELELSFTPQENRILKYIEQGYSNQQIADELEIRLPTVKTHLSNLYAKLGVKNRAGAIKIAKENGYIK